MITADQLVLHAIGDYLIQSDWMANSKTKAWWPALAHAFTYALPFLILRPSLAAFAVILGSHLLIDRFRVARYVCWIKNWLGPNRPWSECSDTGYPAERPAWLTVWLMIIADNVIHVIVNGLALVYL